MESCDLIVSILQYFMPILKPMMGESSEEWLTAILAAVGCDGKTEVPQADAGDVPWMKDSFWKGKELEDSDRANKNEGYYPQNCQFWNVIENNKNIYGLEVDAFYIDVCSKMLNGDGNKSAYKVFNRVHYYPDDPTLTVGFQHLAKTNVQKYLERIKEDEPDTFVELCRYLTYRLLRNNDKDEYIRSYRLQVANEKTFKDKLFPGEEGMIKPERLESVAPNALYEAMIDFFNTELLSKENEKSYATGKDKCGIQRWVETTMREYAKDGVDMGLKPGLKTVESESCAPKDKKAKVKRIMLFQDGGDNPDDYESGFWFHDLFKAALLLKNVARMQIRHWEVEYFNKGVGWLKTLMDAKGEKPGIFGLNLNEFDRRKVEHEETVVTGILSLVSFMNTSSSMKFEPKDGNAKIGVRAYLNTKDGFDKTLNMSLEDCKHSKKEPVSNEDKIKAMILITGFLFEEYCQKTRNRSKTRYIIDHHWVNEWETKNPEHGSVAALRFMEVSLGNVVRKGQGQEL